jgi:hypothetical protein
MTFAAGQALSVDNLVVKLLAGSSRLLRRFFLSLTGEEDGYDEG